MSNTDPGTPSLEYELMQAARELPRMLDSSDINGGVNRLRTRPGGKITGARTGPKTFIEDGGSVQGLDGVHRPTGQLVSTGAPGGVDSRPLLIQHQAEGPSGFAFRAATAAPEGKFWGGVKSVAAKPFKAPLKTSDDAPEALKSNGEWVTNADLQGNSLRALAGGIAVRSGGYGLAYWWVDFDVSLKRPFVRTLPAESVSRVADENGIMRIHVRMARAEYENPEDRFDPSKFPVQKHLIMVFRDGDPSAAQPMERFAWYEIFEATENDKNGSKFETTHAKFEHGGKLVDSVSLKPLEKVPLIPMPSGNMTASHFILPPMAEAAQLEYLQIQVNSNVQFMAILANTALRFASGLKESDITEWKTTAPDIFYATTNDKADMKWVTLAGEAINAGMDLGLYIARSIEVAALSPMLTRAPGAELATSMALSSATASSVAEGFYHQWQSSLSQVLTMMGTYATGGGKPIMATIQTDVIRLDGAQLETGALLLKLYTDPDPSRRIPALQFYSSLVRLGILEEHVDIDAMVAAAESPEMALEKQKINAQKADALLEFAKEGFFSTEKSAIVLYRSLDDLDMLSFPTPVLLPSGDEELDAKAEAAAQAELAKQREDNIADLAAQAELARQRSRNLALMIAGEVSRETFWDAENADAPVEVDASKEPGGHAHKQEAGSGTESDSSDDADDQDDLDLEPEEEDTE